VAIDRDATLKQAEKLLRQGKLDGAIGEYVRLVEDQPQDWNSINALGDLYLRAGKNDLAVDQFTRIADHQLSEGFFPKAAALFKKALKVRPEDEHILMALAEIAERQKKFVDAKLFLRQVAKQRQARGDQRAAAEALLRLGSLDGSDVETKLAASQAAQQLGDAFRAVELLKEAAQILEKDKKRGEAFQLLAEAAELDPFDSELRARLAREFVSAGQPSRARAYLSYDTAGDDPDLLLALATVEFAEGKEDDARIAMGRLLALAPAREPDIVKLADELMEKGRVDSAYACIDAITDAALLQGETVSAAAVLRAFADRSSYLPALAKLVEISADAQLEETLPEAQARLVDGYLAASHGDEARVIAEDLLRADPANDTHAYRLRRAFELLGEGDPDAAVARVREGNAAPEVEVEPLLAAETTDIAGDELNSAGVVDETSDLPSLEDADIFVYPENDTHSVTAAPIEEPPVQPVSQVPPPAAEPPVPDAEDGYDSILLELSEIDLSSALSGLIAAAAPIPMPQPREAEPLPEEDDILMELDEPAVPQVEEAPPPIEEPAPDIEDVFAQMRAKSAREQQASAALGHYEDALQFIRQGLDKEAIAALESAARVPMLRFKAAAQLGRLLIDRGDLNDGVEWLERAAEAPAPTPDEGYELLYELAGALEAQGEPARALAILMELDAESDGYRDVRTRIVHLSRDQTGSSRS
jgi:tetratricopeptide (TPR) repeat protein